MVGRIFYNIMFFLEQQMVVSMFCNCLGEFAEQVECACKYVALSAGLVRGHVLAGLDARTVMFGRHLSDLVFPRDGNEFDCFFDSFSARLSPWNILSRFAHFLFVVAHGTIGVCLERGVAAGAGEHLIFLIIIITLITARSGLLRLAAIHIKYLMQSYD